MVRPQGTVKAHLLPTVSIFLSLIHRPASRPEQRNISQTFMWNDWCINYWSLFMGCDRDKCKAYVTIRAGFYALQSYRKEKDEMSCVLFVGKKNVCKDFKWKTTSDTWGYVTKKQRFLGQFLILIAISCNWTSTTIQRSSMLPWLTERNWSYGHTGDLQTIICCRPEATEGLITFFLVRSVCGIITLFLTQTNPRRHSIWISAQRPSDTYRIAGNGFI